MTRAGQFVVQNPRHHLQASVDAVAEAMAGVPAAAPWAKDIRAEWSKLSHAAATASDDAEAISALEQRAELLATRVGLAEDMAARQDRAIDSLVGFFAARGYQPHLLGSDADRRLVVEKDGYGLEWGVSSEDDETWSVASRPVAVGRQVVGGARMVASPDGTTRDELCTLAMAARQALDDASVGENEGLIEHEPFPATLPVIQVGKESPNSNAAAPQEERSRGM